MLYAEKFTTLCHKIRLSIKIILGFSCVSVIDFGYLYVMRIKHKKRLLQNHGEAFINKSFLNLPKRSQVLDERVEFDDVVNHLSQLVEQSSSMHEVE